MWMTAGRIEWGMTRRWWPGLALTGGLAVVAIAVAWWPTVGRTLHLSPLIVAIFLGMIVRNVGWRPAAAEPGVKLALRRVLRAGIVLLGFQFSMTEIVSLGVTGVAAVGLIVGVSFIVIYQLARWLGLNAKLAMLIAAGHSICGASAVVAADAVIDARQRDTTFAVALVTVFGSVAMFTYPIMAAMFAIDAHLYGFWTGGSIHEVAQVVAAGFSVGDEAGRFASLVKLTRVMCLIPASLGMVVWQMRQPRDAGSAAGGKVTVPWFVLGFVAAVMVNSLNVLPGWLHGELVRVDLVLLATAMAAMGLETSFAELRQVGVRPIVAGLLGTGFISAMCLGVGWLMRPIVGL